MSKFTHHRSLCVSRDIFSVLREMEQVTTGTRRRNMQVHNHEISQMNAFLSKHVFLNTPLMYADKKSALKEPVEGEDESFSIAEHVQKGIQPGGGRSRTTSSYCQHFQTQASWTPSERVSSWAQRALWQERCCVFCIYLFKYTVNILLII